VARLTGRAALLPMSGCTTRSGQSRCCRAMAMVRGTGRTSAGMPRCTRQPYRSAAAAGGAGAQDPRQLPSGIQPAPAERRRPDRPGGTGHQSRHAHGSGRCLRPFHSCPARGPRGEQRDVGWQKGGWCFSRAAWGYGGSAGIGGIAAVNQGAGGPAKLTLANQHVTISSRARPAAHHHHCALASP
jgi:hypothetical protein